MLNSVFGAKVDWISQHSVLPEYFRQQFYETGRFFPEFAANIGGGQNIYNFAYYGLYSPLILPSYLLPFVKMSDYIMAVSFLCLIADVLLCYRWLRGNDVSRGNSALTAVMFLLAGPMIFHSYNQIMFVNYMPFLLMGLLGTDRYFRKRKSGLFVMGVFLMIMTSFYFSIGGILVLIVYGVYRYMEVQETGGIRLTFGGFLQDGIKFCVHILTAVLMSGVLLAPAAMAIMGGRKGTSSVSLGELFLPDAELFRLLYNPYGIGLTALSMAVLLTGLTYRKWREKYIYIACIVLLIIPFFMYLLNGTLYIRDKALIPMLPLLCYLTAVYLEKQSRKEIPFWQGVIPFVLTFLLLFVGRVQAEGKDYRHLVMTDGVVMLICVLVFYWKHWEKLLIAVSIVFLVVFQVGYNMSADKMLDKKFYDKVTDREYENMVRKALENEEGFYRMEQFGTDEENAANLNRIWSRQQYSSSVYSSAYNDAYQEFRQNTFEIEEPYRNILMQPGSKNPVWRKFMGVKYILSETEVPGYKEVKAFENVPGGMKLYEREEVLPIAYVTDKVLLEADYKELKFPYNQTVYMDYAVAGKAEKELEVLKTLKEQIVPAEMKIGGRHVQKELQVSKAEVPKAAEGDLLFVQFKVENNRASKDVSIWFEDMKNKLTAQSHIYYNDNEVFTYAVPLKEGQKEVEIVFGAGDYEISGVESYIWKTDAVPNGLCQSEFMPDKERTKGNCIVGEVEVERKGYFITSIPYDENFEALADGKPVEIEKVNTAFLGFKIEEGKHKIEIIYHAPGLAFGKALTLFGVVLYIFLNLKGTWNTGKLYRFCRMLG